MKKMVLSMAIAIMSLTATAQERIGLNFSASNPSVLSLNLEYLDDVKTDQYATSTLLYIGYSIGETDVNAGALSTAVGNGFEAGLGFRYYLNKNGKHHGFFYQGSFAYGNLTLENTFLGQKFEGTYRYLSIFNPEIGYKLPIVKNLTADLNFGYMWRIEMKPKGDLDNQLFDNWMPRIGLGLHYAW